MGLEYVGKFICATDKYCTLYDHVNAPYIRKVFCVPSFQKAELPICGLGFYEAYINGKRITKGKLAPYIANPDHTVYYDRYDVSPFLTEGENAFGAILGNGTQNNMGGWPWAHDQADFRSSPKLSLALMIDGQCVLRSDTDFRWAPSPITFDDLRCGEYYDARLEQPGWNTPGFDDSTWQTVQLAQEPKGEKKLCTAEPVEVIGQIYPVSKTVSDGRLLIDFGINTTGVCRLKYRGAPGQQITLWYGEALVGGTFYNRNVYTPGFDGNMAQKDILICSGREDVFEPKFTYHGFRYVFVEGIFPYEVADDFIVLCQLSSNLKQSGTFTCSDETVNALQKITVNSDRSNFLYFPVDCPQREKNGWTADAALSAEQLLCNLDCGNSLSVWLEQIRKAQLPSGQIPAVVPTVSFGFAWGSGPAWDQVLIELPYQIYRYTGDRKVIADNQEAIFRYLTYLRTKQSTDGLIGFGLCDWCETGKFSEGDASTPVEVTDTLVSMDMCRKAAFLFRQLALYDREAFCNRLYDDLRQAFQRAYVDKNNVVTCKTQTGQAMAISAGVFPAEQTAGAVQALCDLIERDGGCFRVGVLGARVLFRVLAENGHGELAHRLITQKTFPSYRYWLDHGATSLWEGFHELQENSLLRKDGGRMLSLNHHFWGDISAWFYRYILGLTINPDGTDASFAMVAPCKISSIQHASGSFKNAFGSIHVSWVRGSDGRPEITVATTGKFHYRKEDVQ